MSFSLTTALSYYRICLTRFGPLQLLPLPKDEAAAKGSPLWQNGGDTAGIAECSCGNCRIFLVCFENRTSSTRSSSGNGTGINVSLHKGAVLKGMLHKLKLSKYILVYRSNLVAFWYTLVCFSKTYPYKQTCVNSNNHEIIQIILMVSSYL